MSDTEAVGTTGPIFREIAPAHSKETYTFTPLRTLSMVLTGVLAARIALGGVEAIGLVLRLQFLDRAAAGEFTSRAAVHSGAAFSDGLVQVTALISLFILLAAYLLGGVWIHQAARNVRALGARGLENSPGWAVGWFAVPFMSLFKPLMAMSEIWRASHDPQKWRSQAAPPLLAFWWTGWIASSLFGSALNIMGKQADNISGMSALAKITLTYLVVETIAMGLFLAVVWNITRAQSATRHMVQEMADTFS